jgi:putative heme-binding domain-containing protein
MLRPFAFRLAAVILSLSGWLAFILVTSPAVAQRMLEAQLTAEDPAMLAETARAEGDPTRGAIVFHQPHVACTKCHAVGDEDNPLGPDLTRLPDDATDKHLVESVLQPSQVIRQGYEMMGVYTFDGRIVTGLAVEDTPQRLVLRDVEDVDKIITLDKADVDDYAPQKTSAMPIGQVDQLASRQEFLDLIAYLIEIRDGGAARAQELQPPPSAIALVLPEYEQRIDHAGMIEDLDEESFERGEAIYNRVCVNCHGTHEQPGSLPTSLRFGEGQFKNGSDPHTMYQTLTRGFGMMVPQTWMVPQQKYDVIHYIREAYLSEHNAKQYVEVDQEYLAQLPQGDTRGPEPVVIEPWVTMDYGPSLVNTYEVGRDGSNLAYKGIAVRVDTGPGGISRGNAWMLFDHDTMRVAACWTGDQFIDWKGIHFNGQHQVHPRVVGDIHLANATGPGWARPTDGSFDDPRLEGRDGRRYGPLPRTWSHYKGLYHDGHRVVLAYSVGDTEVWEMPGMVTAAAANVFTRSIQLGPRSRELVLRVADGTSETDQLRALKLPRESDNLLAVFGAPEAKQDSPQRFSFDGATAIQVSEPEAFELTRRDFSIVARIRTRHGGTIFAKTHPGSEWVPDGKALFVRDGRLCFDIGWVGVVQSRKRINDGQWHDVVMTWDHATATVRLYIDGGLDGQGRLRPSEEVQQHVVRIGLAAPDFPEADTFFRGQISEVRFFQQRLDSAVVASRRWGLPADALVGHWRLDQAGEDGFANLAGSDHKATVVTQAGEQSPRGPLVAGLWPPVADAQWSCDDRNRLQLKLPAGPQLNFVLWMARLDDADQLATLVESLKFDDDELRLATRTRGGPPRWEQRLNTQAILGDERRPFAVDVLPHPAANPWLAQVRLTGFDFFPGGDRAAVCAWDGDVWMVSGLRGIDAASLAGEREEPEPRQLVWQRIASGLFQPLGLKVVDGRIFVTCRDQLVVLHDLNGDGETDFYENFNNDHQVTDHFHEFAMGLQRDDEGNFYYAKAARHALPALVPHHGTLLKVSPDGSRTEILANGFRAPNGVCLNEDGTFMLTDQEGHWTPKNRINWVVPGGFYGNMFGYHDVASSADDAMQQPICWITNAFDRSPSELVWVTSPSWGPLQGSLLNLSYGYGKIYVVPFEEVNGQRQGGMCELPIAPLPTGIMRGRFHPADGQLYTCGMFAWAGNQQQPGGFYRIRYTGQSAHLPIALRALQHGIAITFTDPLEAKTASDAANFSAKVWTLKRTAEYGSDHIHERPAKITAAELLGDGRTVMLRMPHLEPTWCMEIRYRLRTHDGLPVRGSIHNTIHRLGRPESSLGQRPQDTSADVPGNQGPLRRARS